MAYPTYMHPYMQQMPPQAMPQQEGILAPPATAAAPAPGGMGILGSFGQGLHQAVNDNADAITMAGMSLLGGGGFQGAAQSWGQGARTDMARQTQAQERAEKERALKAWGTLAKKMGAPDELLANPDPSVIKTWILEKRQAADDAKSHSRWQADYALRREASERAGQTEVSRHLQQMGIQPGTPEYATEYRRLAGMGRSDYDTQVEARKRQAEASGLKADHPAYQSFILTGKMPREDAQPLTATDKKAIMEADEGVEAANNALISINRAKDLSSKAYEGPSAGIRGKITGAFGSDAGQATSEMDNEVVTNALSQMKAIFGSTPTEGERQILLEIQGSSSMPHDLRMKVFAKAEAAVQRRLAFNKQRADAMRGGTYYQGPATAPGAAPAAPQSSGPVTVDGYTIRQK